jgi:broad specificity phosphatase PhoE
VATTILLVRHGETDWNREHRYQGHADQPLNDAGRAQARELAEILRDERATTLYTSPLRRASETAEIVGERLGLVPRPLEALREIDVGDWQGLTVDEVKVRFPERAGVGGHAGWSGGETHDELGARVVPALVELGGAHPDETVLGVTHAGPIRSALMAALGISHDESRALIGPMQNCAVFRFAIRDGALERRPAE